MPLSNTGVSQHNKANNKQFSVTRLSVTIPRHTSNFPVLPGIQEKWSHHVNQCEKSAQSTTSFYQTSVLQGMLKTMFAIP